MFVIIAVVHIADHDAGDAGMDKFIIAQVDAYMGDGSVFAQGMEKDEVAFLQLFARDPAGSLVLFFRGAGQGCYSINGGKEQEGEGGAVDAVAGSTSVVVGGTIPVFHEAQQFLVVHFFYGGVLQDSIFELEGRIVFDLAGCISCVAVGGGGCRNGAAGIIPVGIRIDSNIVDKLNRRSGGGVTGGGRGVGWPGGGWP